MHPTDLMGGFAKGLSVIIAFDETHPRLSIAEVSALTGLDRATARRCLLTLADLGYADYDGKFFSLTQRVLRLGYSYLAATPLPRLVQPFLEHLSQATGESASVSVLDGTEIVYVARASQKRVMSINLNPGSRLPAYCASMGRVLLAALPEAAAKTILEQSAITAHTPLTKTAMPDLLEELARVRAQGYAVINQELEMGLCSIAVPLHNMAGKTVAALNIGAQAARISAEDMVARYLPLMRETQQSVTPILP
jgi:IclR family pca regulon transcriptional regulator